MIGTPLHIGPHSELPTVLDNAAANGTLIFVAAGNLARVATGRLLGHPATVPVAAVDLTHRYLQSNNFGPVISDRGIAAIGHQVPGYAAGGGICFMSGTSVATFLPGIQAIAGTRLPPSRTVPLVPRNGV
jgi:hypothetical protein